MISDITMCTSINCPVRASCYRKSKKASENQRYYNFEYTCNENNGFADYMTLKINKNINIIKSML